MVPRERATAGLVTCLAIRFPIVVLVPIRWRSLHPQQGGPPHTQADGPPHTQADCEPTE